MKFAFFLVVLAFFSVGLKATAQENTETGLIGPQTKEEADRWRDSLRVVRMNERKREAGERLERYLSNNQIDTLTVIDLSDCDLQDLPDFVLQASSLKSLKIDGNSFRRLPAQLDDLDSLQRIYWRKTDFNRKPVIPKLPQVERFYMSGSKLPKRKRFFIFGEQIHLFPAFRKLSNLEYLELKDLGLTRIPERKLRKNTNLNELLLDQNAIRIGEEPIDLPSSLRILKLNKMGLQEIGTGLYDLTQLEELQLIENQISIIPPGISRLKNLTKLTLYKNEIEKLPNDLFGLPRLAVIDLYYNQIQRIPGSISQADNLEVLYLAHNRIFDLPESIGDLQNLEKIYLQDNRLSVLPESIGNLRNLKVLRISKNYLSYFPRCILQLRELEEIDVNDNDISSIPAEIESLPNLKLFTFQDTNIDFQDPSNQSFLTSVSKLMKKGVICKPTVEQKLIENETGQ